MGNVLSCLTPSQWLECEKMESPLLLSLLQEKLRDDDTIPSVSFSGHSSFPQSPNNGLKNKRDSDSFLSSPLYEGAKEDIRLRARKIGWIREDKDETTFSLPASPRSSVESQTPSQSPNSEPSRSPPTPVEESERPLSSLIQWPHLGSDGEKVTFDTYAHHLRHMLTLKVDEPNTRSSHEMCSKDYRRTSRDTHSKEIHRSYSVKSASTERSIVHDLGWDDDSPLVRQTSIRKSLDPRKLITPNSVNGGVSWTEKLRTFGNRKHQMRHFTEEVRFDSIREVEPLSVDGIKPSSIQTQATVDSNTVDRLLAAGPQPRPMAPRLKDRSYAVYHGMISM